MNITDLEYRALDVCRNYSLRESQLSDNFSNGGHCAFMNQLNLSRHAASALCGSLESKGLGFNDNENEGGHILWLTEEGVNALFDWIDAGRPLKG